MEENWVKLYRRFKRWEWYKCTNAKVVFIELLLSASKTGGKYKGHEIPVGSVVTSVRELSENLDLSGQEVRTAINKLTKTGEIEVETTNKFSIITLLKYDEYQATPTEKKAKAKPAEQKPITQQQPTEQPWNKVVESSKIAEHIKGQSQMWKETAMMALLIGKDNAKLESLIEQFQVNCISSGVETEREDDVLKHFVNWARKRIQAEKAETKKNATVKNNEIISTKTFKGWTK